MSGHQPKHMDPNGQMRRAVRSQRFAVVELPDCYRGTVAAGAVTVGTLGAVVAGDLVGASAGAAAYKGTIGASGPFSVLAHQSLILYGTAFSGNGNAYAITFTIRGYDLDWNPVFETIQLSTTNATTQSKSSAFVYAEVTSIEITTLTPGTGTLAANPLFAVGHGVSTVAGAAGQCRFPISAKITSFGQIRRLVGPDGLPIAVTALTCDTTRHTLANASGTTLLTGTYVVHWENLIGPGNGAQSDYV